MKKSPPRDINDHILSTTEGVLTKVTDYVLAELYFHSISPRTKRTGHESPSVLADRILKPKAVSRALAQLMTTGMVQRIAAGRLPSITYKGKERLEVVLPKAGKQAESLFLVAYDIPRSGNVIRNRIRETLLKSHAIAVLDSLWMSPIDPTDLLADATGGRGRGAFFVTALSANAVVNGEAVKKLVTTVYRIEDLELKYNAFLASARNARTPSELRNARYLYLSAVKDDPGLPAGFLPKDFPSVKAAKRFRELTRG